MLISPRKVGDRINSFSSSHGYFLLNVLPTRLRCLISSAGCLLSCNAVALMQNSVFIIRCKTRRSPLAGNISRARFASFSPSQYALISRRPRSNALYPSIRACSSSSAMTILNKQLRRMLTASRTFCPICRSLRSRPWLMRYIALWALATWRSLKHNSK